MRRRTSGTALTTFALAGALLLAGCTVTKQIHNTAQQIAKGHAAPSKPVVVELRTAPTAPMATTKAITREILRRAGTPRTPAIKGFTVSDTKSVVTWIAAYLAQIHGDHATMCATDNNQPATKGIAAGTLRSVLRTAKGREAAKSLVPRLTTSELGCAGMAWAAPGVVVGPQLIRLSPGSDGSLLDLTYKGSFGYFLHDKAGHGSVYEGKFAVVYGVDRSPSGSWQLVSAPAITGDVGYGWPSEVLPHGFSISTVPPKALIGATDADVRAVTAAVAKTLASPAATWRQLENGHDAKSKYHNSWTGRFALARGDGVIPKPNVNGRPHEEEIFDHGHLDIEPVTATISAKPGDTVPPAATWTAFDPTTAQPSGGEEVDTSPFVNLSVVALANSARKTPCTTVETAARATRCFVSRTQTAAAAYSRGIAARYGWTALARSDFWLDFTVGVDAQGRLVSMRRQQSVSYLGHPTGVVNITGTFTDFSLTPPEPAVRPVASSIARDGTYGYSD